MEWAAQNPFLPDALLFQYLGDHPGACAIVPIQGDAAIKSYVNGASIRAYSFALQMLLRVSDSTDEINTGNMHMQRQWTDWIMEQERNGTYPDFGPGCSGYRLEITSNMPTLAQTYEGGTGKYQTFAILTYREESLYGT